MPNSEHAPVEGPAAIIADLFKNQLFQLNEEIKRFLSFSFDIDSNSPEKGKNCQFDKPYEGTDVPETYCGMLRYNYTQDANKNEKIEIFIGQLPALFYNRAEFWKLAAAINKILKEDGILFEVSYMQTRYGNTAIVWLESTVTANGNARPLSDPQKDIIECLNQKAFYFHPANLNHVMRSDPLTRPVLNNFAHEVKRCADQAFLNVPGQLRVSPIPNTLINAEIPAYQRNASSTGVNPPEQQSSSAQGRFNVNRPEVLSFLGYDYLPVYSGIPLITLPNNAIFFLDGVIFLPGCYKFSSPLRQPEVVLLNAALVPVGYAMPPVAFGSQSNAATPDNNSGYTGSALFRPVAPPPQALGATRGNFPKI